MKYIEGEIFVETSLPAADGKRRLWVNARGNIVDLPPSGEPPIIIGLVRDPGRLLVDTGSKIPFDLQPEKIGLSAQALPSIIKAFKDRQKK